MRGLFVGILAVGAATGFGVTALAAQIPAALGTVEGSAEDAFDHALANDLATVKADAAAIKDSWTGFRDQAAQDGAAVADVNAMDAAVMALVGGISVQPAPTPVQVARAANAISGHIDALYSLYSPSVPPAVNRLDYLGREIQLDGLEQAFTEARQHIADAEAVWIPMKPAVLTVGGAQAAANYEASLERLKAVVAAGNSASVVDAAKTSLDLVDAIERVFPQN